MQSALRAIGSDVTMATGDNLASSAVSSPVLNFHLRNAQITASGVNVIANALNIITNSQLE